MTGPSPRDLGQVTTFDGKVVLFGGSGTGGTGACQCAFGETWTFDGATWTHVIGPGPSARYGGGMATLNGKAVLFGGETDVGTTGFASDTWTFDGTTWTQLSGPAPVGRAYQTMTTVGDRIVLYGGRGGTDAQVLYDTWTFDGTSWTQLSIPPPGGLVGGSPLVVGPAASALGTQAILFGGDSAGFLNNTYSFDGASWAQVDLAQHPILPSPRVGMRMATLQ